MGTDIDPVPVTGLAANFSPMPRMAPPPLGKLIVGADTLKVSFSDGAPPGDLTFSVPSIVPPSARVRRHSCTFPTEHVVIIPERLRRRTISSASAPDSRAGGARLSSEL